MSRSAADAFLSAPRLIVILLSIANVVEYGLIAIPGHTLSLSTDVLVSHGALIPAAVQPHDYWRLVAYGFLHANLGHLIANCASLLICGPFLERRLGSSSFAILYIASLIGAAIVSLVLHTGPFVAVGASGAIFGILGALFALWFLGATELSPAFFLANFALNFAIAARDPQIDWAAHIGGFLTGMVSLALLDILARTNYYWLRCKFPEFVKMNVTVLIGSLGAYLWFNPIHLLPSHDPRLSITVFLISAFTLIKTLDYLLAARYGLVGAVLALAACNGYLVYVAVGLLRQTFESVCRPEPWIAAWVDTIIQTSCLDLTRTMYVVSACASLLTLIAYLRPLRRGLRDVGFVGATFMGDRQRERGLVRPVRYTRV